MKNSGMTIKGNTIILTKAYAQKAYTPGTAEFRELSEILKAYPHLTVTMRSAKQNGDKEKHDGLSIQRMGEIIRLITDNDENATAALEVTKAFYKNADGYYGKVKRWFLANYPNYKNDVANKLNIQQETNTQPEQPATLNLSLAG